TNWEQWNTLHAPVVGFRNQKPFAISSTEHHSVYWRATELRVPALREYFLKVTPPMPLLAATGAGNRADPAVLAAGPTEQRHRYIDVSKLDRGRKVFANNCITCHSSVQPPDRQAELDSAAAGQFWDRDPGKWLTNAGYIAWAEKAVEDPLFWKLNYLSTDERVP